MKFELISFILVSIFWISAYGKTYAQRVPFFTSIGNDIRTPGDECPEKWKMVGFERISFCIPDDLKSIATACKDSRCLTLESPRYNMGLDFSHDAYRPTYEKKLAGYTEKRFWVNEREGISIWIWSFEETRTEYSEFRYHSGALFVSEKDKDLVVGMTIVSKTNEIKDEAEIIFRSVNFKVRILPVSSEFRELDTNFIGKKKH